MHLFQSILLDSGYIHSAILPNPLFPYPQPHSQQTQTATVSTTTHVIPDLSPDFYYYDVDGRNWVKLSSDTYVSCISSLTFFFWMIAHEIYAERWRTATDI